MNKGITGYIGTYTEPAFNGRGEGIYSFELNPESGVPEKLSLCIPSVSPSYLCSAPSGKYLYAVNEVNEFEGQPSGAVSAFAVEGGTLRRLNQVPSEGASPCHIAVDQGESFAVVSNYSGGSAAVFPLLAGGLLGKAAQIMRFTGRGPNVSRQEASHAHSFIFDPSNNYGFVCDLGADRIWACRIKPGEISSPLTDAGVPCFFSRPGSGPRHGVFHPSGKFCYVVNELESTVDVLGYEPLRGSFIPKQSLSSLPPGEGLSGETPPEPERADNTAAAIRISAGGEFVYVSNRGHNSITLFKTEPAGTLGYIDCVPAGGKTPRDFLIDPSGKFLLGCNQDSDSLVVFRIEQNTGQLKKQGIYTVPSPVCLLIPQ